MIAGVHTLLSAHDAATERELEAKGVEFAESVTGEGWELLTRFRGPRFGELRLHEPRDPASLRGFS